MTTPSEKKPVTGWQRDLVIRIDRGIYWFTKHWLATFNFVLALYVGLPALAPVLMSVNATGPARVIYTIYRPMCHQMASRSFFLFGEQYAYPRTLAGTDLRTIEDYIPTTPELADANPDNWVEFQFAMREFIGNEQFGYKMALCERDMAIYAFLLTGGIVYGILRRRYAIKPLPLLAFIIVGLGPISLDGFSQLFGYMGQPIPGLDVTAVQTFFSSIFPLRESTPLLRTGTGALFGFMLAWLALPHVNEGMKITERDLEKKLRRIGEL